MATSLRGGETPHSLAPRKRLALVLNEKAGALLARPETAAATQTLVREAGFDLVEIAPRPLPERIAEAAASGADIVAVAGGDGTIACAARALAGADTALGIVPAGTMDLLARDLGLPIGNQEAALAVITEGRRRRIDVGMLGDAPFLCAAMLGTPARLARHREQGRALGNGPRAWVRFGRAALRALRREPQLRARLTIDGRRVPIRTPSLTITVNPLDDRTGRAFGRSRLDGGRLAAYIVRGRLLGMLPDLARGRTTSSDRIATLRGREIVLESNVSALHVLLDGEPHLLAPPLRFRLRPGALTVIAP